MDSLVRPGLLAQSKLFPESPQIGSQGRDMSKWYQPFGLLLVSAMVANLTGCAQTGSWLSRKSGKDGEEKVASADKKPGDKSSKDKAAKDKTKSSQQLADAKAGNTAKSKDGKPVKPAANKSIDSEHEKYTAADRQKKAKPPTAGTAAAKGDVRLAAADARPNKPVAPKSTADSSNTDDRLDAFLDKIEPASQTPRKAVAKKETSDEFERPIARKTAPKDDLVQVKKEVSKEADTDELEDWATAKTESETKSTRVSHSSPSFDDDFDKPFVPERKTAAREEPTITADDSYPSSTVSSSKSSAKKSGYQAMCPDAGAQLNEILKGMDSADPESLKHGLHQIGQLGDAGNPSAPVLRKMLKHDDAFVRVHAALAMSRLQMTSSDSIAVVTDALKSRDASLRSFSANVLNEMGPRANDVLRALAECLDDRDGLIQIRVAEVLIRHDNWSYRALQTLLTCLKSKDDNVRWMATFSLAELAPESQEAVQALMKATKDPLPKVRLGAVRALAEIGPYAKSTADDLARLADSSNDTELKSAVRYAIQQMNEPAE